MPAERGHIIARHVVDHGPYVVLQVHFVTKAPRPGRLEPGLQVAAAGAFRGAYFGSMHSSSMHPVKVFHWDSSHSRSRGIVFLLLLLLLLL